VVEIDHSLNKAYEVKIIINESYNYHKKKEIDSLFEKRNGKPYVEHRFDALIATTAFDLIGVSQVPLSPRSDRTLSTCHVPDARVSILM